MVHSKRGDPRKGKWRQSQGEREREGDSRLEIRDEDDADRKKQPSNWPGAGGQLAANWRSGTSRALLPPGRAQIMTLSHQVGNGRTMEATLATRRARRVLTLYNTCMTTAGGNQRQGTDTQTGRELAHMQMDGQIRAATIPPLARHYWGQYGKSRRLLERKSKWT